MPSGLLRSLTASALAALLAGQPLALAATPPQLTGDARILHALNRFTFGPRPGDLAEVRRFGLDRWFEQQLHPATIADTAFEHRLADFPALSLPQTELIARFPDNQRLRVLARQNAPLPTDPAEHAIYRNGIAREREQEARKAAAAPAAPPAASPGSATQSEASGKVMRGNLLGSDTGYSIPYNRKAAATDKPAATSPDMASPTPNRPTSQFHREAQYPESAAAAILSLSPDQRVARLLTLAPDDLAHFHASLSAPELARLADGLSPAQKETLAALGGAERVVVAELLQARLERDIESNRQLEAVMTDFWLNHFNVYLRKNQREPYLLPAFERDTIRPHALGRFEDLLVASASSPAMLVYLDNAESIGPHSPAAERASLAPAGKPGKTRGLNENYARELMELHTIGVRCETSRDHTPTDPTCGPGYTQADVTEVARVFTGWTVTRPEEGSTATYIDRRHEPGDKHVLGHTIPSGGEREGMELLHLLANDPATARFICTRLAVRFVSDTPPPTLIARMTTAWQASHGDISAVLRAMFHAPEFWSAAEDHSKVKTPLEFVASAARASAADITSSVPLVQALDRLGMPLFGMQTPNGYAWTATAWVSTGALVSRLNFALVLAGNRLPGTTIDPHRLLAAAGPAPVTLEHATLDSPLTGPERQLEFALLDRPVSARTRAAILEEATDTGITNRAAQDFLSAAAVNASRATPGPALHLATPSTGDLHRDGQAASRTDSQTDSQTAAAIIGLLLGSPEFQRR